MASIQLKTGMMTASLMLVLGLAVLASTPGRGGARAKSDLPTLSAPVAGFGGVLVPKRVRLILGFVQTLPA